MAVVTRSIEKETAGFNDIHDITAEVSALVEKRGFATASPRSSCRDRRGA